MVLRQSANCLRKSSISLSLAEITDSLRKLSIAGSKNELVSKLFTDWRWRRFRKTFVSLQLERQIGQVLDFDSQVLKQAYYVNEGDFKMWLYLLIFKLTAWNAWPQLLIINGYLSWGSADENASAQIIQPIDISLICLRQLKMKTRKTMINHWWFWEDSWATSPTFQRQYFVSQLPKSHLPLFASICLNLQQLNCFQYFLLLKSALTVNTFQGFIHKFCN